MSSSLCFMASWLQATCVQAAWSLVQLTGRRVYAQVDFMPAYAAHLRTIIQKGISHPSNYERPLEGFHIIVDAGDWTL